VALVKKMMVPFTAYSFDYYPNFQSKVPVKKLVLFVLFILSLTNTFAANAYLLAKSQFTDLEFKA